MIKQLSSLTRRQEDGAFDGREDAVNDPNDSRANLERTVRARDSAVSGMEKKKLEKEQELAALQKELEEERLLQMKEAILHRLEADRLQRQTEAMEERLEALERDMQDKDAIHEYANLIKGVAPKSGVDSQYVMKLQSQLAKAVKKMEATSQQMELVEQSCNEVVSSLKAEITEIVEDRCRTELELRKQLELLEEQKAEMQKDYDEQIRKNQEEMERLKQRAAVEGTEVDLKKELQEAENRLKSLNKSTEDHDLQIKELTETLESVQASNAAADAADAVVANGDAAAPTDNGSDAPAPVVEPEEKEEAKEQTTETPGPTEEAVQEEEMAEAEGEAVAPEEEKTETPVEEG